MSTIVTRAGKGSALTHTEVDANFTNLNTDKLQSGNTAASLTITSADINGGTVDGTVIGGSTPAAGTFTSLTDSGNLTFTGTGNRITGDFSNATIANRVMFQTSTVNGGTVVYAIPNGTSQLAALTAANTSGATNGSRASVVVTGTDARIESDIIGTGSYLPMTFFTGGSERMRVDTSGNVGLGVVPSASTVRALQVPSDTVVGSQGTGLNITTNAYFDGSWKYHATGAATWYQQSSGAHGWWTAPSGTAGNAITFTQAMTLNSSGIQLGNNVGSAGAANQLRLYEQSGAIFGFGISAGALDYRADAHVFYTSAASPTERMRIDSSGNVGIGTSSPGGVLSVYRATGTAQWAIQAFNNVNTGGSGFWQRSNGQHEMVLRDSSNNANYITNSSNNLEIVVNGSERARIDSSGNVGIGTGSPVAIAGFPSVTVNGSTSGLFAVKYAGTDGGYIYASSTSFDIDSKAATPNIVFRTNGTERARIASGGQFCVNTTNTNGAFNVSGNVYLFSQSAGAGTHFLKWNSGTGQVTYDSSSRLVKDNIVDSPYGLAEVMQLKSRKYLRIDDQRDEIGLIADEVQSVMPEFVPMSQKSIFTKNKEDTELVPSGVYYEKLSSVLVKAIQEQQQMINELKAKVAALENA